MVQNLIVLVVTVVVAAAAYLAASRTIKRGDRIQLLSKLIAAVVALNTAYAGANGLSVVARLLLSRGPSG
jgi:hypothetical protein